MGQFHAPYFDSEITTKGHERIRIYVPKGGPFENKHHIKLLALKEFTAQKEPIFRKDIIKPFHRVLPPLNWLERKKLSEEGISLARSTGNREILLERQEHADAAFYYMRFIL